MPSTRSSHKMGSSPAQHPAAAWRLRLVLLAACHLGLVTPEFGTITNTVYDCQYDLTQVQCITCQGKATLNLAFYDPKPASCISSAAFAKSPAAKLHSSFLWAPNSGECCAFFSTTSTGARDGKASYGSTHDDVT